MLYRLNCFSVHSNLLQNKVRKALLIPKWDRRTKKIHHCEVRRGEGVGAAKCTYVGLGGLANLGLAISFAPMSCEIYVKDLVNVVSSNQMIWDYWTLGEWPIEKVPMGKPHHARATNTVREANEKVRFSSHGVCFLWTLDVSHSGQLLRRAWYEWPPSNMTMQILDCWPAPWTYFQLQLSVPSSLDCKTLNPPRHTCTPLLIPDSTSLSPLHTHTPILSLASTVPHLASCSWSSQKWLLL